MKDYKIAVMFSVWVVFMSLIFSQMSMGAVGIWNTNLWLVVGYFIFWDGVK